MLDVLVEAAGHGAPDTLRTTRLDAGSGLVPGLQPHGSDRSGAVEDTGLRTTRAVGGERKRVKKLRRLFSFVVVAVVLTTIAVGVYFYWKSDEEVVSVDGRDNGPVDTRDGNTPVDGEPGDGNEPPEGPGKKEGIKSPLDGKLRREPDPRRSVRPRP
jgi:hypothetical protein